MFCSKCGYQLQDDDKFCQRCGSSVSQSPASASPNGVKVMLDPAEAVPQKPVRDSSQSFSGQGKTIGLILMILSIVGDLVAMFTVGFGAFIPVTIGATVLFVIGFLLRMFCP